MAQELVVNTWCDIHLDAGEHEAGEPTPTVDGRLMDLCKVHREALLLPFLEHLERLGRRAETPAPSQARAVRKRASSTPTPTGEGLLHLDVTPEDYPFRCPFCDRAEPTGSALGAHLRAAHNTSFAETYGGVCPVCGAVMASQSGIGMHLTKSHGVTGGTAVAFEWARLNGDPAGVVAERLAAWAR